MARQARHWMLTGITPLMQSNADSMITDEPAGGDKIKVKKKKVYNDAEEAEIRCYRINGKLCHPSACFRASLMKAATNHKFGKMSAASAVEVAVHLPVADYFPVLDAEGKPAKSYVIDKRTVVVNKSRIVRCRPKFPEWKMQIELEIDDDFVSPEQVTDLLNIMGSKIGLGEFRPERDYGKGMKGAGKFGRFTAELV